MDHVYKIVEIVGTSGTTIEEAISKGLARASEKVRHIGWFEVKSTRGRVVDGRIEHYQVELRIGFTLEE